MKRKKKLLLVGAVLLSVAMLFSACDRSEPAVPGDTTGASSAVTNANTSQPESVEGEAPTTEGVSTTEKGPATDGTGTTEKDPVTDGTGTTEKDPATDGTGTTEKDPATDGTGTTEKDPATDGTGTTEKDPATDEGGTAGGGDPEGEEPACSHTFGSDYLFDANGHWHACSACGEKDAVEGHTPAAPVIENQTAANCGTDGHYDEVIYCSVCNYKISSEKKTVEAFGEHISGAPVIENEVASTCEIKGSFDEVTYCSVCGTPLLRVTKQSALAEHDTEVVSSVPSTCESNGVSVNACKNCDYTETETLPRASHAFVDGVCSCGAMDKKEGNEGLVWEVDSTSSTPAYVLTGFGDCTDSSIYIPSEIGGIPVTSIAPEAFKDNTAIIAIYFSDAITTVGAHAFEGCSNLEKIVFSNSIVSIGQAAFKGCVKLGEINLPDSVTTVGAEAFRDCESVTRIVIGEGVTSISGYAFYGCRNLEILEFRAINCNDLGSTSSSGNEVFSFGGTAVDGFDVVVGEKCTRIPANLFYSIGSITGSPELLEQIPVIKSVTFPGNGVCAALGERAFACLFVPHTTVFVPQYVTTLGNSVFAGARSWVYGSADPSNLAYSEVMVCFEAEERPSTFAASWSEAGITFSAGGGAFSGCAVSYMFGTTRTHGLSDGGYYWVMMNDGTVCVYDATEEITEADIPAKIEGRAVSTVAAYAFYLNHRLTKIVIPASVTWVADHAFGRCTSLATVEYRATDAKVNGFGSNTSPFGNTSNANIQDGMLIVGKEVKVFPQYLMYFNGSDSFCRQIVFEEESACERICQMAIRAQLTSLVIPASVTTVDYDAIECLLANTAVYYGGTAEEWARISIGNENKFTSYRYFYAKEEPTSDGLYWRYVDGVPTVVTFVPDAENRVSLGLSYQLSTDGTYYVLSGIGTCTDTEIIVSATYNGLPVKEIAGAAFYNRATLSSFTLPAGITSIGINAFFGTAFYSNPENWVDGALYIGNYLIKTDANLSEHYTVKDGTTLIAACAFEYGAATTVTLPDSVQYICGAAFRYHSKLTALKLSPNLLYVGEEAFRGCTSLEGSLYIPAGQTAVYVNTFHSCKKITEIVLPEGLTEIMNGAFYNCNALTTLNIPSTLKKLGTSGTSTSPNVFTNCSSLKSLIIPNGVARLSVGIFAGCTALEYLELPFVGTQVNTSGNTALLGILFKGTDSAAGLTVYVTQRYNLSGSTHSVSIPASLKTVKINGGSLGVGCFDGCIMLKNVILPENLTTIGTYAFAGCKSLLRITLPATLESIAWNAFSGCVSLYEIENLSSLELTVGTEDPSRITDCALHIYSEGGESKFVIDENGFVFFLCDDKVILCDYVGDAAELVLPEAYEGKAYSIGHGAFFGQRNLTAVKLPENLISIGSCAFAGCISLTSEIVIPNGQTEIGAYTFYGCTSLTGVTLSESVITIGNYAFNGCAAMTEFVLTKNVATIEGEAFAGCRALKTVYDLSDAITVKKNVSNGYIGFYTTNIYTSLDIQE